MKDSSLKASAYITPAQLSKSTLMKEGKSQRYNNYLRTNNNLKTVDKKDFKPTPQSFDFKTYSNAIQKQFMQLRNNLLKVRRPQEDQRHQQFKQYQQKNQQFAYQRSNEYEFNDKRIDCFEHYNPRNQDRQMLRSKDIQRGREEKEILKQREYFAPYSANKNKRNVNLHDQYDGSVVLQQKNDYDLYQKDNRYYPKAQKYQTYHYDHRQIRKPQYRQPQINRQPRPLYMPVTNNFSQERLQSSPFHRQDWRASQPPRPDWKYQGGQRKGIRSPARNGRVQNVMTRQRMFSNERF